ncbi:hypothetical protein K4F52_003670 [Lecanicillium sp. MT-2017a]|nr:hypothetical protein K4F52_003670 [Lecanicillium sp. MT-2017a]
MAPHADLAPRIIYTYDDGSVPFWYTETGYIVRWVLFSVFVLIVLLWVVGGYFHARHRIKKGLRPMGYHSCFAPRRARYSQAGWYGSQQQQQYGHNAYNMNNMPPPPMYDSTRPPEYYAGPPDGTKVDPSQWRSEPTRRPAESSGAAAAATTTPGDNHIYEAPPGPPPAVVR